MDQTEKEEERDNFSNLDLRVVITNYVNNKIAKNERVTINHINSLQVCRNHGTRCADILQLVRELSFGVEDNDDKTISALEVSYEF